MKRVCVKCNEERKFSEFRSAKNVCWFCLNNAAGIDPWHERECQGCGETYKPRTVNRADALRSTCCSRACAGRRGVMAAMQVNAMSRLQAEADEPKDVKVSAIELEVDEDPHCPRCSLRGAHVCLQRADAYGRGEGGVRVHGRLR